MGIHAELLARALRNFDESSRNGKDKVIFSITYKNKNIPMPDLKVSDNLKKYTLSELREIAYLVLTHHRVYYCDSSYSFCYRKLEIDYKKLMAVIKFIEKDLFNINFVNDDYHNLKNEYDELKLKYDELKEKLKIIID
ncbi:putative ORFan [Cotonvirus japonicus]|uniref:ORFan n=1 Tax=Cotonvirus japonicus TaxID=2811091 RepID=A0ABM7NUB5_9VIRU|nr:putative ORFan [Cotonvirus japonicus]BCS83773.1 putative ORFan [Cotonvirus japonicus]